ncbi:(2R)-phospho-3-sulfolactate synthase, ComA [Corchorus olitorius]|uniref:(2R)-phospho-3-sulfolactate synthase, ComA n=1 Tax=Corchorus olitorius TaxID=93759 RepID=A0A1R3G189_9ROSI|nr:(2R)-phospho-3-sulfolactate synthase, ComA [Corchorus olitorius]
MILVQGSSDFGVIVVAGTIMDERTADDNDITLCDPFQPNTEFHCHFERSRFRDRPLTAGECHVLIVLQGFESLNNSGHPWPVFWVGTNTLASKIYPQQADTIQKNGYIVIKNRPCKGKAIMIHMGWDSYSIPFLPGVTASFDFNGTELSVIEAYKYGHNVYVSTGDWAEHVLRKCPLAIKDYVEEFKQMGFDTIELNVTSLEVPEETLLRYVRLIKSGGLKAKNIHLFKGKGVYRKIPSIFHTDCPFQLCINYGCSHWQLDNIKEFFTWSFHSCHDSFIEAWKISISNELKWKNIWNCSKVYVIRLNTGSNEA